MVNEEVLPGVRSTADLAQNGGLPTRRKSSAAQAVAYLHRTPTASTSCRRQSVAILAQESRGRQTRVRRGPPAAGAVTLQPVAGPNRWRDLRITAAATALQRRSRHAEMARPYRCAQKPTTLETQASHSLSELRRHAMFQH